MRSAPQIGTPAGVRAVTMGNNWAPEIGSRQRIVSNTDSTSRTLGSLVCIVSSASKAMVAGEFSELGISTPAPQYVAHIHGQHSPRRPNAEQPHTGERRVEHGTRGGSGAAQQMSQTSASLSLQECQQRII